MHLGRAGWSLGSACEDRSRKVDGPGRRADEGDQDDPEEAGGVLRLQENDNGLGDGQSEGVSFPDE